MGRGEGVGGGGGGGFRGRGSALAVTLDAGMYGKTDADRMREAEVSKDTWYRVMKDADFARIHRQMIRSSVNASVSLIINQSTKMAIETGRDGYNDRRMLLEMSGHYTPRQQIDHTTAGQPIIGVVGVDPNQL